MAVSDVATLTVKCLVLPAAIIGGIQAAIWLALSLISILYYNNVIGKSDSFTKNSYGFVIYNLYLRPDESESNEYYIYPKSFNISMYFYVVLSFIWLLISIILIWVTVRKKWNNVSKLLVCWSTITIIIAVLDVVMMSLIAADLHKAQTTLEIATPEPLTNPTDISTTPTPTPDTPSSTTSAPSTTTLPTNPTDPTAATPATDPQTSATQETSAAGLLANSRLSLRDMLTDTFGPLSTSTEIIPETIYTAMGIVMSLAARGYILWIVNVVFAIILAVAVAKTKKNTRPSMLTPIIDAYAGGSKPFSMYDQVEIDKSFQNEGFKLDENIFSPTRPNDSYNNMNGKNPLSNSNRSSLIYAQTPQYAFEMAQPLKILPAQNGRLAKIGKAGGRRSPPRRVPSPTVPSVSNGIPYIPEPDYTPPGSPKLQPKSVLRPKSNYEL